MSNCRDPKNRNKHKKCVCGFHSAKARRGKAKYKSHRR
jgi:hypothetical protein